MTLELKQVARQVKTMGAALSAQKPTRDQAVNKALELLEKFSTDFSGLAERLARAEKIKQNDRFGWVGAAPAGEPLAQAYPLPACPNRMAVIAADGSQILPDQHAIFPYYLINVGSIIYRHGSNQKPETHNPPPVLCYEPFDDEGRLVSPAEINVLRDMAELDALVDRARHAAQYAQPVVALRDGRLPLRVIDLLPKQQKLCQDAYIEQLNALRGLGALAAGYIDRPRSTFVPALLRLAALAPEAITEDTLRTSPFRRLTDLDLFDFLEPGQRSALFAVRAKGLDKYDYAGHAIHFFYLNVSKIDGLPALARVEIPGWLAADPAALDTLHAVIVRQARLAGGYPYVLARADELAVISSEERAAVEMMLAVEMRRSGLTPELSQKRRSKDSFR
jgi:hypothetical protein